MYAPGQIRVSASMNVLDDGFGGVNVFGYVIGGSTLYASGYHATNGVHDGAPLAPIGGGWGSFVSLEEADYQGPTQTHITRRNTYALRNDGTLFRWTLVNGAWRYRASAPGFAAVKTMALVSKSATYDTFVATTRGGALYTIHVPTSTPMKPVVKRVRSSTWQGFETLLAQKCGVYGTFLVGIDHDTNSAYAYAVGRFNGASTVIQGLGKIPGTFPDALYFRWKDPGAPLTGE
ncbi:hypothetical protein E0H50_13855 [Kribbella sindirgiensis]|uniref:Uncharacterized protein n=1 Tax=Kribbella sindirgiensis TaxID=1124744 RepID=A0A4R0IUK8_9ACTN|nr:hypothetical protein E0H50_13855 [Kribbella sindirgiensis]